LLGQLNLFLNRFDAATRYFESIKKIGFNPIFDALYFRKFYDINYNNDKIEEYLKIGKLKDPNHEFNLENNPFHQNIIHPEFEELVKPMLDKINNSYI